MRVPFNRPYATGRELEYIAQAIEAGHISGDGQFTKKCNNWLRQALGVKAALLTHSCTAALEMAALLAQLEPGDEVIMPSFTFVSTANAFVLRGAVPVFVDVRNDTLNIDETRIEEAITPRTKAICVVHYAGVGCNMDPILEIAARYDLWVIEDAAQGIFASYKGRPLGSMGDMGCLSFHETKNLISGEGGALLVQDEALVSRAEILREKGTNRTAFFRGLVDKYTWVDLGSSYLPSDIIAAFLYAQLEKADDIIERRHAIWRRYWDLLANAEARELVRRPIVPPECQHNAHMFYVLTRSLSARTASIDALKARGLMSVFHYVPLHSSPAGTKFGRAVGTMEVTNWASDRLLRLPLWVGLPDADVLLAVEVITQTLADHG
jgi:dTDP-4-amino-4,6-dideoxygalactose transaminase